MYAKADASQNKMMKMTLSRGTVLSYSASLKYWDKAKGGMCLNYSQLIWSPHEAHTHTHTHTHTHVCPPNRVQSLRSLTPAIKHKI